MEIAPDESAIKALPTFDRSADDRMQFARMNIRDWLQGMRTLKPDQIGVYNVVLFLLYDNLGLLRDDDRYVAGHCQMEVRYYKKIKAELVALGKIEVRDGHLWNRRATSEIASFCATAKLKRKAAFEREANKREARALGARQAPERSASGASQVRGECATGNSNPETANDNNGSTGTALPRLSVEKEKEKESTPIPPKRGQRLHLENIEACREAFHLYNETAEANALPRASRLTDERAKAIGKILKEFGPEGWRQALSNIPRSPHLIGQNDTNWRCHLEFLTNPKKFIRVHDGGYLGQPGAANGKRSNGAPTGLAQMKAIMGGNWHQ